MPPGHNAGDRAPGECIVILAFRFFRPPEIADAIERLGFRTGSGDDQVGEVGQRVAQMIWREWGKFDVLAEKFGDR